MALGLFLVGYGALHSLRLTTDLADNASPISFAMSVLIAFFAGATCLSLAFASKRWGRLYSFLLLFLSGLALPYSLAPEALDDLSPAQIAPLPGLYLFTMAGSIGVLLATRIKPPRSLIHALALVIISGGLVNLTVPHSVLPLWLRVNVSSDLTIVISAFIVLFGSLLPTVPAILRNRLATYAQPVLWPGIIGIAMTLVGWQTAQQSHQHRIDERAELLASGIANSIEQFYDSELAILVRMAERFGAINAGISSSLWNQETASYFRDLPYLEMIAIMDHRMGVQRLKARSVDVRLWLGDTLDTAEFREWIYQNDSNKTASSSGTYTGPDGQNWLFFSAPITVSEKVNWTLLALVNVDEALHWLASRQTADMLLQLTSNERLLFSSPLRSVSELQDLATKSIKLPHDSWTLTVSQPRQKSYADEYLTATLILFGGLALTTLVMISRLFGAIATHHNQKLQTYSHDLEHYLEREKELRALNKRIIDFTSDLLCIIDQHGQFKFVSPASNRILGYAPEVMENQPCWEFIYEEDWDSSKQAIKRQNAETSDTSQLQNRYRHRDGHLVTIDWKIRLSPGDNTLFCVGRDVTAELEAVKLARQRAAFFSITREMLCIVKEDHFVEINPAFLSTLGYAHEELIGRPFLEIVHPDSRSLIASAINKLNYSRKIDNLEFLVSQRSGNQRWLRLNAAMSDQRIHCSARDITEEKAVEKKLKDKDRLLSLAEDMARLGGWMLDLRAQKLSWSDTIRHIHDLPPKEQPSIGSATDFFTPEFRPQVQKAMRLASDFGESFDLEAQIVSATGKLRWVRVIGQAAPDDTGRIVALQGAMQDITESKEAHDRIYKLAQKQTSIFQSITDAFFMVDKDWRFTFLNEKCEELLQRSSNDLIGRCLWEAFPEAVGTDIEAHYRRAVSTGETASFEAYYEPLDLWGEAKVYPSDEGLAVYFRSINERKKAEKERDATMAELQRSNMELKDFAFVASHDLQEPLRKIQTFSNRLLTNTKHLDDQQQDYLKRMDNAAKRMQRLITDLLAYSRVSTRAQPFRLCDLNSIVNYAIQNLEVAIAECNARIDVAKLPNLMGDPSQLQQLFQNLLSNSIKFRQPGIAPYIRIYSERTSDKGLTLVIEDNGVGFNPKYADRIFQPFQRLHNKKEYAGTGIGLAIVRKIVERHQGTIKASGTQGSGACFQLCFEQTASSKAIMVNGAL